LATSARDTKRKRLILAQRQSTCHSATIKNGDHKNLAKRDHLFATDRRFTLQLPLPFSDVVQNAKLIEDVQFDNDRIHDTPRAASSRIPAPSSRTFDSQSMCSAVRGRPMTHGRPSKHLSMLGAARPLSVRSYPPPRRSRFSYSIGCALIASPVLRDRKRGVWRLRRTQRAAESVLSSKSQDRCMEQVQNLDLSPMSAVGAALLRFILAGFWIAHWWFKVGYRGIPATEAFFLQHGLPLWLAWLDISFEVVIALCLVLGIYVPLLCLISLPILFASMWIYRRNGFYFSGGGIELPVLWACAQIAQVFLGPGAFRIPLPVWLQLPTLFGIPL
jgi:putative oxidoreductase